MDRNYTERFWGNTRDWDAFRNSYFPKDENAKAHKRSQWAYEIFKDIGFNSILETGSNCGRNLYHIKKLYPEARLAGIDINPDAVEFSKTMVDGTIINGSLYDLDKHFQVKFDIVFSMAVMIHIAPEDLQSILSKMLSLAKKAIVHFEYNNPTALMSGLAKDKPRFRVNDQYFWAHDITGYYKKNNIKCSIESIPEKYVDIGLKDLIICEIGAA